MRSISGSGITCSSVDDSLAPGAQRLQDSVSKRRRHAIYFHRPPVWRYSSFQDGSSSPEMSEDLNGSDRVPEEDLWIGSLKLANDAELSLAPYVALNDSDSDHTTPLLEDRASNGELVPLSCRPSVADTTPDPFHQRKPIFCTRLHSYKDIRLGLGEPWAIQEGSLVISICSEYTVLDGHGQNQDEFELSSGEVFVVCSLYADLWALCAKVSFNPLPEGDDPLRVAFLPLCAITLVPNYSAFVQRSTTYSQSYGPHEKYPGNGLPVMPPRRSHSLTASRQIFRGLDDPISLPSAAHEAFRTLALKYIDEDFVPLDSTLKPIFSPLTRRRHLLRRVRSSILLSRSSDSDKQRTSRKHRQSPNTSLASICRKASSKTDGWRRLRRWQSSSSGSSLKLKWLSWKT
ncbi:uncharacterized protein BDV14DRAFT_208280 [Aspergillus stella-maris]|uniref:uncharacterized protein n=1 Tax=Aspergillus stella-maris TaxID=1810926 RepID=UPI003CCD8FB2